MKDWLYLVLGGALAANLVPFLEGPGLAVQAAWCWKAQPPKCKAPSVVDGACKEGATIPAGGSCTPTCKNGKVAIGSCTVKCPPSGPQPGCLNDYQAKTWWDPCDFGDKCLNDLQLGMGAYQKFGSFECIDKSDPRAKNPVCSSVVLDKVVDVEKDLNLATALLLGGTAFVAILGAILARGMPKSAARMFFWPGPMLYTVGTVLGYLVMLGGFVAACFAPKGKGIAAGTAAFCVMAWSYYMLGADKLMGMTREAAWKVHIFFGDMMVIFGIVHGIEIMTSDVDVTSRIYWILGPVGLILAIIGIVPTGIPEKFLSYDRWKVLHFASPMGYVLLLVHMIDHAFSFKTAGIVAVAVANAVVFAAYVAQKVYTVVAAKSTRVKVAEVVTETCGKHVFLSLSVPKFKFKAGQWGRLSIPAFSLNAHPFTLIPGEADDEVKIFMKVGGSFTRRIATACEASSYPAMRLEGPFGIPAAPMSGVGATVLVLGGVGITPGLSLAREISTHDGDKTLLYWSTRSPALLRKCASILEPHIDPSSAIQLTCDPSDDAESLPLNATHGMKDVSSWLKSAADVLRGRGVNSALLFVCGPPGLSSAAKSAAAQGAGDITWHLHIEEFRFLPQPPAMSSRAANSPAPVKFGAESDAEKDKS
eukprot:TRINITY_DN10121_c2_g1_i1.p1 TRINITY_DN10121_c2_g1~~TRINITY_DN10121_c2_g1_i1.p1  ORF type:complete len:646 (-),score=115.36 TRINITY_DN10121_c2_g1_i1:148-2085(-)